MRNESSIKLNEFKEQIIKQIKNNAPNSTITESNVTVKVKLSEEKEAPANTVTIRVDGMMCGHCEATVKQALEKLDFAYLEERGKHIAIK